MLKYLLYICVFTLSFGQLASIYKSGESSIYLFDIFVIIFVVYGVVYFLIHRKFEIPKYFYLFFVFSTVALISLLAKFPFYNNSDFLISGMYLVRWLFYLLSAVIVYNMINQKIISEKSLIKILLLSGILISAVGFLQLIILPDFAVLDPLLGWDPHKNRLASTFFDPNFTGTYLSLCLAIAIGCLFKKNSSQKIKRLLYATITIITAAIFLTFSRSAWTMTSAIVFIYGFFKSKKLLLLALILGFLAYFAVPRVQTRISGITDPADSARFRLNSWKNALTISKDNLLLGTGFNTFRYVQKEYGLFETGSLGGNAGAGTDSSFLLILATTGIFGLIIFSAAYFWPVLESLKNKNLIVLSSLLGLLINTQFVNSIFYPQILFLWTTILTLPLLIVDS